MQCVHLHLGWDRRNYVRCVASALRGGEYCWVHDPSKEAVERRRRAAARSRIRSRQKPLPGSGKPAPGEPEAVARWMTLGGGTEAFLEFENAK